MCCSLGTSGPSPKKKKRNGVRQVMRVEVNQKSDERRDCGNKVQRMWPLELCSTQETQRWSSCSKSKHSKAKARLKKMLQS